MDDELAALRQEVAELRARLDGMADRVVTRRVDILEPDGTRRLIISSRADSEVQEMHGHVLREAGQRPGGMIFFDDRGVECGGLIYGCTLHSGELVQSGLSLTMDKFDQDQTIALQHNEDRAGYSAYLAVVDRPDRGLVDQVLASADLEEQIRDLAQEEQDRARADFYKGHAPRVFLGRDREGRAELSLNDSEGRPRIRLRVEATGESSLDVLDEHGKVHAAVAKGQAAQG